MRLDIIQIGNSKGLRLPKSLLEQCGIKEAVNIEVDNHTLVITACSNPRKDWENAFQKMSNNHDDELLDLGIEHKLSLEEEEEWQW